jgi:hypothetical protein
MDSADKNTASLPGSMIRPARAANTAVASRSAIPTWHSAPAAATASTNRSAAACSEPK